MNKNILIIRNAYPYDFGGGERIPVELALELKKLGYSPTVVSRSPKLLDYAKSKDLPTIKGWWWSFQDWSGLKLFLLPAYLVWHLIMTVWYVFTIIKTSADIVHPQSRDDFISATIAGKVLNKRIVWTDHADLKYIYKNLPIWYKNPIGKIIFWLSKYARAVILVSENEKNLISNSLGKSLPKTYLVIYNGVNSQLVTPKARNKREANMIIFTSTSRLVTAKGIGELIEAFRELTKNHKNIKLWIFGEGPEEEKFKAMARDEDRIEFKGFPENTLSHVASADVFVHPSYHEGFSVSLIEAAKLGLPIIACNVGGNPELVVNEKNGLLVPERNSEALLEAMEKLIKNPDLRKQYGKAAREAYEANLMFENVVKNKIAPLYEK